MWDVGKNGEGIKFRAHKLLLEHVASVVGQDIQRILDALPHTGAKQIVGFHINALMRVPAHQHEDQLRMVERRQRQEIAELRRHIAEISRGGGG